MAAKLIIQASRSSPSFSGRQRVAILVSASRKTASLKIWRRTGCHCDCECFRSPDGESRWRRDVVCRGRGAQVSGFEWHGDSDRASIACGLHQNGHASPPPDRVRGEPQAQGQPRTLWHPRAGVIGDASAIHQARSGREPGEDCLADTRWGNGGGSTASFRCRRIFGSPRRA